MKTQITEEFKSAFHQSIDRIKISEGGRNCGRVYVSRQDPARKQDPTKVSALQASIERGRNNGN